MSSPGEGSRSSGGEVWCRDFLFPAFQEQVCWGFLQCGIGGADERLLRCSTLPLTKTTCQVTCSTTALWTTSKDYYSTQILQTLIVRDLSYFLLFSWAPSYCSSVLHKLYPASSAASFGQSVFLFLSSERHNRIGLLDSCTAGLPELC